MTARALLCAIGVALTLAAAGPAQAAPEWNAGTIERSQVINCPSQISGYPSTEAGAVTNAEFYADASNLPKVGEVFYVRTIPAAIGRPCASQSVAVEIVLPIGVELAIGPATPVRCVYFDIDTGQETPVGPAEGCPQQAGAGVYGQAINRTGPQGPAWGLPYGAALRIEVPVRSARPLRGIAAGAPSCPRLEGQPPCRSDQAGDSVQFAVHVFDGNASPWLSPYVGLFVTPAPEGPAPAPGAGPPPAAATPLVVVASRSLRIARAVRGIPVRVRVATANATVSCRLTARAPRRWKGRLIARVTRRGVRAGMASLRLKPSAAIARALRRARRVDAELRVTVRAPGAPTATATKRITLRR